MRVLGVVVASAIGRSPACASSMSASTYAIRFCQPGAAAHPSSRTTSSGPFERPAFSPVLPSIGRATLRMMRAASASRRRMSHHGVWSGCSSFDINSRKSRKGGNAMRSGRGGVKRRSHQMTGSASSAHKAAG